MSKAIAIFIAGLLIGGAVAGAVTYMSVRIKWFALGEYAGEIAGKRQVMDALCAFKQAEERHEKPDFSLSVKASLLTLVRTSDGVIIYCSD